MTTWNEKMENLLKYPPIGTPEWFACIPPMLTNAARELVGNHTPVVVQQKTDSSSPDFFDPVRRH